MDRDYNGARGIFLEALLDTSLAFYEELAVDMIRFNSFILWLSLIMFRLIRSRDLIVKA